MASLGVGGVGQSAAQYLQQLTGQQPSTGDSSQTQSLPAAKHHRHHHHGGGGGGQQSSNILDVVASALQTADASSDPNQVVEDTVSKLLTGGNNPTASNGKTALTAEDVQVAGNQAANQPAFLQVLQSHGISLQQFQSDLSAAVKDAQQGNVNPATALASFPPGSTLNLTA
jgi:hypothetical protein